MQYQFLLDATGSHTNIYFIKDEFEIIYHAHYLNEKNLSYELTNYIQTAFNKLNISYQDINKIFLVYGPGKFSAMRISSILVKTWNTLFKNEIFIIDKLNFIAKSPTCICVIEADGNKYYVAKYKNYRSLDEPVLMNKNELENFLNHNEKFEIYYNEINEISEIGQILKRFKKVDNEFILNYHRLPC